MIFERLSDCQIFIKTYMYVVGAHVHPQHRFYIEAILMCTCSIGTYEK